MLDALHEIPDTREAEPERFDARFAVELAAEEATEHRDLSDDLAKGRWLGRRLPLRQNVRLLPLGLGEEWTRDQIRGSAPQLYQTGQAPRYDHIHGQRQFQLGSAAQLQRLYATAILEHVEEDFDFPPAAIPITQFNYRGKVCHAAIGQQAPLHRLATRRRIDFLGNDTGNAQHAPVAIGDVHGARPYPVALAKWKVSTGETAIFVVCPHFAPPVDREEDYRVAYEVFSQRLRSPAN